MPSRHRHHRLHCILPAIAGLLASSGIAAAADGDGAPVPQATTAADVEARLNALDQQVRVLARRLEIADEEAAKKAKEGSKVKASDAGFFITSNDDAFKLRIGGYVQADGRFYLNDKDRPQTDSFLLRRVRPILEANLGEHVFGRIMTDFGGGTAVVQDAYLDFTLVPAAGLRVGKFKPPVGLERLQSGTALLFIERALPTQLVPNRDEGAQFQGEAFSGKFTYSAGIFNGTVDAGSRDADVNNGKEGVARVWLQPFKGNFEDFLDGLGFGVGGSWGQDVGTVAVPDLPTLKTSGQDTFLAYAKPAAGATTANTAVADGTHWRVSPQLYWGIGQFGLLGEYVLSNLETTIGARHDQLRNSAYNATASYVLTGEKASFKGVIPKAPFSLEKGGWGAFELAARVTGLTVDPQTFTNGYASRTTSASEVLSYGAGVNWYLTRNLKWQADYEITRFHDGAATGAVAHDRQNEHFVSMRFQVSF